MALSPDVLVYVCHQSIPATTRLPRQWTQHDAHVVVHEVPCSGKIDAQYLLHALEGGARGVCLVTCPKGACQLSQGNYRAQVRIGTIQRLLGEVGLEPQRAELLRSAADDGPDQLLQTIRAAVDRIAALGPNPLGVEKKANRTASAAL
jgi:coenzyme F420-reducing hydrogenase delta subunit